MKTLIFNGSPRKNGDTVCLINAFLKKLTGEYKIVNAYDCEISPCIDCRYCWKNSGCSINDGMQEIYDYINECDNVLIASPIYFSELTGKMLDVGSRLQTYYCAKAKRRQPAEIKPKKGAVILAGGGDGRAEKAFATAKMLLWNMNCRHVHELVLSHKTDIIPAAEDKTALAGAESIAEFFNCKL